MTRAFRLRHTLCALLLLLLAGGAECLAQGAAPDPDAVRGLPLEPVLDPEEETSEAAAPVESAPYGEERVVETLEQKGGRIGFNFIDVEGYGGRALEYGYLKSSRSGGLFYRTLEKDGNFELEGNFLNENDYHGDLLLDYQGDYRLHLRTESLFHNLDRELLFPATFQSGRTDAPTPADYIPVQDFPANYGISVTQDLAEFRYRLHNFPMHVNLGYWRLVREGVMQQRFADTSFEGTPDTVYAMARRVHRQIQEGRLGLDAHLGWVDLIYDFKVRVFEDRRTTPFANYVARNNVFGNPDVVGGLRQHNEDPDSRFLSHTVKLHSSLSGSVVASGSYSIEQRENLSRLSDVGGVKHNQTSLHNAAGDLVYTPFQELSLALKYRHQQQDNDRSPLVSSLNFVEPIEPAKKAVDTSTDLAILTLTYRPRHDLSLTGEYRGEYLRRSQVSDLPTLATWALPETSATQRGSLTLLYRPIRGLRLAAKYRYVSVDHPSYGNSFEEKHQGELLATYTGSKNWGASANLVLRREQNNDIRHFYVNFPFTAPVTYTPSTTLARDRASENANLSLWYSPRDRVTLSASYAYLRSRVDQGVLFTGIDGGQADPGSEALADFTSRSHVYGVNASFGVTDKGDISLGLQQVRSQTAFAPQTTFFSATSNTLGIRELTEQDTVISSASARAEYRFSSKFSGTVEYAWSDYHEKNPVYSSFNGTVNSVGGYLTAKW